MDVTQTQQPQEVVLGGVRVETYGTPTERPPVVFVHGGCQGSWAWEWMAPWMAARGWHAACLNWFGHHGSRALPDGEARARSIADVTREIGTVADWLGRPPVVVAHSMGGLASLAYAGRREVAALVLLAPVVPAAFGGDVIELPVDPGAMWGPPPPEVARHLFWDAVDEPTAARYHALLDRESPQAVLEATRWLVEVDVSSVRAPAYVVAADRDPLVPARFVESLAAGLRAECRTLADRGHGIPVDPGWDDVIEGAHDWLLRTV